MSVMLAKSQISHSFDNNHSMCTACIQGQMTRIPFSDESHGCVLPYKRIHSDTWSLFPVKSFEGYKYVVLVDDCVNINKSPETCNMNHSTSNTNPCS